MGYALRELHPPKLNGKTYLAERMPKWKPRLAKKLVPRSELRCQAAETALNRVREYLFELGEADKGLELGWMKYVSDKTGIPYDITRQIIHHDKVELTLYVAQRLSDKTGIPLHVLFDMTVAKTGAK